MPVMLCVLLRNWRVVNVKNVTCAMVARVRHAAMRHPRNRIMKHRTGSHSEAHVSNHHGHHAPALSRVKADDLRRPYGCTLCSLWFETEEEFFAAASKCASLYFLPERRIVFEEAALQLKRGVTDEAADGPTQQAGALYRVMQRGSGQEIVADNTGGAVVGAREKSKQRAACACVFKSLPCCQQVS
jgi:hypothetical protein